MRFAVVNAVLLAWTLAAVFQPWVGPSGDIAAQIARKYLPFALLIAAAGTALVARVVPAPRRPGFLWRHHAVYLVVPLLLFVASRMNGAETRGEVGAVYLLAFALWSLHALEGLWHGVASLTDRAAAALLAAVLLVPFLALMPYHRALMPTASDEPHYLIMVQSLLRDRDLDLKDEYDQQTYRSFYEGTLPDRHVIDVGDAQYPIRDLGLPLLAVVPFAIAGRSGVLVLMCLVGALLAAQLYLASRDLRIAPRPAFLAVAFAGLAHPLLTYTTQIYPELPAALVFVTVARLLRRGRAASPRALALASLLLGMLPWLSARAWLIAVGVALVIAYVALRPDRPLAVRALALRAAAGALPFAALVLLLAGVDYLMFRIFIPNVGYYVIRDQQQVLAFTPQIGVLGLLFDEVFGLVPRTPLLLLAAVGLAPLVRRARGAELAALALGWLVYFLYIADIAYWWADGSPPSRYLVASLPFLVVLLAAGIEHLGALGRSRAPATAAAWVLAAFSLFVAYVYAVLPNIRYDIAADIKASGSQGALFTFLGRVLRPDPAVFFPSLVQASPADLVLGGAWLAAVVGLVIVGLVPRGPRDAQMRSLP